jgi:hypothetical protein
LLAAQIISAQKREELKATFVMSSKDGKYSCSINSVIKKDGDFAGYFLLPGYGKNILGKLGHGYDFMNYETSGVEADFLASKWIENNFFLEDLEGFSLGPDVKTTVSFHIKPFYSADKKSNKKAFVAKFAILTPKNKIKYNAYDEDCDVKLFYKLLYPDSTGFLRVNYLTKLLPDYQFTLNVSTNNRTNKTIELNPLVFNEIKKSVNESLIDNRVFEFSTKLAVYPPKELGSFENIGELANHEQVGLADKHFLVSDFTPDTLNFEHPIYCANIKFPFRIYNEEKNKKYGSYKTINKIFMSDYEIIIIPIRYENDLLTADVITNYSKINLNDGLQRWTPFKKRIDFKYKEAFIDYPHENWSAVFSRGSENYEIYGYSDYEKYVKEMLSIKLQKVF